MLVEEVLRLLFASKSLSILIILALVYWGYRKVIQAPYNEPDTPVSISPVNVQHHTSAVNTPIDLKLPPRSLITQPHNPPIKVIITTNKVCPSISIYLWMCSFHRTFILRCILICISLPLLSTSLDVSSPCHYMYHSMCVSPYHSLHPHMNHSMYLSILFILSVSRCPTSSDIAV